MPATRMGLVVLAAALSGLISAQGAAASVLDEALGSIRAEQSDLALRPDLVEEPHQLKVVLDLMERPLSLLPESRKAAETLLGESSPSGLLRRLAEKIETPTAAAGTALVSDLQGLASSVAASKAAVQMALPEGPDAELLEFFRIQLTNKLPDPARLKAGETWNGRDQAVLERAGAVPQAQLLSQAVVLLAAAEVFAKLPADWGAPRTETIAGVRVVIGSTGTDVYDQEAELIVDPGGDDVYLAAALKASPGSVRVIIDLSGDDLYVGKGFGSVGAGLFGIGILIDVDGDDVYIAEDGSLGAGLFGVGVLWDKAGTDLYQARSFSQGAAAFGVGMLIDDGGTDLYRASYLSQGMGYVRGAGLLRDRSGNDIYSSGFSEPDPRGYLENYGSYSQGEVFQSLSQGFGYGWRGFAGGGLGFLLDGKGNDQYLSDYFGQGSSYWYGWGLLYDGTGNDSYLSRRYSQGAGVHFSVGALLDLTGNDRYQSWAVSQGAGHDYAVGLLFDGAGADAYHGDWSVMGLSNAKGIGILRDQGGADRYPERAMAAQSFWDEKRHGAGIGLFLDTGPEDNYFGVKRSTMLWNSTDWGASLAGMAAELPEISQAGLPEQKNAPESYRVFDEREGRFLAARLKHAETLGNRTMLSEVLAVSGGWGLNTSVPLAAKRALLGLNPERSLPVLLSFLPPRGVFELYNLEEFFLSAPESRVPLEEAARSNDPKIRSRALYYLGRMRSHASAPILAAGLKDPSWRIRAAAARALGYVNDFEFREKIGRVKSLLALLGGKSAQKSSAVLRRMRKHEVFWIVSRSPAMSRNRWSELAGGLIEDWVPPSIADRAAVFLAEDAAAVEAGIAKALALASAGLSELAAAASDPDPEVRRWAAHSLGQARTGEQALAAALGDSNYGVREVAARALGKFGETVISRIETVLDKGKPVARSAALKALAGLGGKRVRRIFLKRFGDPSAMVRLAALRAYAGGVKDQRWAVDRKALRGLLKDGNSRVRSLALELME